MKKIKLIIVLVFVINSSFAQIVNFETISLEKKNSFQTTIGLDMAVIANIEYGRVMIINDKFYVISTEFTLPMGENIFDDSKFAINFTSNLINFKNWDIPFQFGIFSVFTNNKISNISTLGTKISLKPGFYKKSWLVGTEIIYDKFLISNIKHSEYYKETYFSEAKDGWYKNSGGNFHLGFILGKTINKNELNLSFGMIITERFNKILVPYYAKFGYKYIF